MKISYQAFFASIVLTLILFIIPTFNPIPFVHAQTSVITSSTTAMGQVGTAFSYQITANNNPTFFNTSNAIPAGLSINTTSGLISGTPTMSGTFTFAVQAFNYALVDGRVALGYLTFTFTGANLIPPSPQPPTAPTNLKVDSTGLFNVNLSWTASSSVVGVQKYKIFRNNIQIGDTATNTAFPTSFIDNTRLEPGQTYSYSVSAVDTAGNESSQSNTVTTRIKLPSEITSAPVIESFFSSNSNGVNAPITPGQPTNLIFKVTGTPAPTISISDGVHTVANIVSPAVTTTYTLTATNSSGTATAALTVVVTSPLSAPPSITSPILAVGTMGIPFTYQITATDNPTSFDADFLTSGNLFGASHLFGLSVNKATGLVSGTPTTLEDIVNLRGTDFNFSPKAINNSGTGSVSVFMRINPNNPLLPRMTSPTTATGSVGIPFTYQITASNNPSAFRGGFGFRDSADHLVPGLFVDPATGLVSGTPTVAGVFTVGVLMDCSTGNCGSPTGEDILTLTITTSSPAKIASLPITSTAPVVSAPTPAPAILTTGQKVTVTAKVLNVRTGPGAGNKIIATVRLNDVLKKVGKKNGWIRVILLNNQDGWVYARFVK